MPIRRPIHVYEDPSVDRALKVMKEAISGRNALIVVGEMFLAVRSVYYFFVSV